MVLLTLLLLPYSVFWKKELKLSFKNIFQNHIPSLLKIPHWLPISLRTEPKSFWWAYEVLHDLASCFLLYHSSCHSHSLSCALSTQATLASCWSWDMPNTLLSHSICSYLEHSSSRYLRDILPRDSDTSAEIPPHHRGQDFPKSRAWDKDFNACSLGDNWSQGKDSGRKERKLNWSWRMIPRIVCPVEEGQVFLYPTFLSCWSKITQ